MFGRVMDGGDEVGLKIATDHGNNIITLDEAETQRWKDAASDITASWIAEMDAAGKDGNALLNEATALIDKNTGGM